MTDQIKFPGFVSFIASPAGRLTRVVIGVVMIAAGLKAASNAGNFVALLGLVPLLAGALDYCVLGKLLGGSYKGAEMRRKLHAQTNHPELGTKASSFLKA